MVDEVMGGPSLVALQAMRARDTYFFEHAIDGTVVALLIARRLGYDRPALQRLATGCLTRDIGMARIPPRMLAKPGPLSPEEWALVRQHAATGFMILRRFRPSAVVANAVALQHHERQDGLGYPRGMRGINRVARERRAQGRILDLRDRGRRRRLRRAGADRPYRAGLRPTARSSSRCGARRPQLNRAIVGQLPRDPAGLPGRQEVLVRTGPCARPPRHRRGGRPRGAGPPGGADLSTATARGCRARSSWTCAKRKACWRPSRCPILVRVPRDRIGGGA